MHKHFSTRYIVHQKVGFNFMNHRESILNSESSKAGGQLKSHRIPKRKNIISLREWNALNKYGNCEGKLFALI